MITWYKHEIFIFLLNLFIADGGVLILMTGSLVMSLLIFFFLNFSSFPITFLFPYKS